jgi:lauroyl/myristoyl acyltransferase
MVFSKKTGATGASAGVSFRHQWEFWGLALAGWVVCLLPLAWLARISVPLGSLVYWLDARGREVSQQNLDAAFGDTLSLKEKRRIARASYQNFARNMLELFWSPNLTESIVRKTFRTSGLPGVPAGEPCIYVTAHFSAFEWLSLNTPFHIGPGVVVAQDLKNPLLGAYFDRLRSSTGHALIPQKRAIARMLAHLRGGGYFCALVDLNLDPKEASVIIEQFGGLKTCVTQLHAALALHAGAKIVPAQAVPSADGTYHMEYFPALEIAPDATPASVAQQCWDLLEVGIRQRPELWLWSYKHWRYRPTEGLTERYPAYSNVAKRFDAAIRKQAGV